MFNGKSVILGTRITAQAVLGFLAPDDSVDDVLDAYPDLEREDVQPCGGQLKGIQFPASVPSRLRSNRNSRSCRFGRLAQINRHRDLELCSGSSVGDRLKNRRLL